MKTEIIRPHSFAKGWTDAVKVVLDRGDPVALPTETVYGLAANGLDANAVAKIFEAKERPRFDPLIVHLPNRDWLEKVAHLPAQDRPLILKLIDRFWPGPFTIVLPKREIIPDLATAGLETVAVRISAHPVFDQIICAFSKPLAAPSANRFGHISPTTASHVISELDGRIPLVVDAGPTPHGIESTVVAVENGRIDILRHGPVTAEELSGFGKIDVVVSPEKISAPGQTESHYAPKTPLRLVEDASSFTPAPNQRVGLLAWNTAVDNRFATIRNLSECSDLREAAANLFRSLRELDDANVDLILAERVPENGLGAAIMDRLQRAAHRPLGRPDRPERTL